MPMLTAGPTELGMSKSEPQEYYKRRAKEERIAAERASDERAAQSHRELLDQYERLADGEAPARAADDREKSGSVSKEFRILP